RKQIQRLIRTTYLVPGLADRVNRGKIPFLAAVDLSYLKEGEQKVLDGALFAQQWRINMEIAAELKALSKEGELSINQICDCFKKHIEEQGEKILPPVRKYKIDDWNFPKSVKKADREKYLVKALKYLKDNKIELED
ncbi:MAG: hypothetical protein ACRCUS_06225, partial [Anaerovoracaceae bacterium]